MAKKLKLKFTEPKGEKKLFCLDLGTGKGASRYPNFIGVDIKKYPGVKIVADLRKRWPWKRDSVDKVQCHHLIHFFTPKERMHFVDELYRVLKVGGEAEIVVPHWCSARAYGDAMAIQWPPPSEMWAFRLEKAWRDTQNHDDPNGYTCDFKPVIGWGMHPEVASRNAEYQRHSITFEKEAAQDLVITLIKQ